MAKHPDHVEGFEGSLEELAQNIGKMRYDKVYEFLGYLGDDLKRQADNDRKGHRIRLSAKLYGAVGAIYNARNMMIKAWNICIPYMKD